MKKKFGQNFLNNQAIIDEIITSANITADSMIYEVGPGDGALSREIIKIIFCTYSVVLKSVKIIC